MSDRRPDEVLQLCVLDPSCGCGAFLIACFRYLSAWLEHHPDCDNETARRLSLELIERVLHGCDIDPGAVSWTIRLQLLAVWETLSSHTDSQSIESTLSVPHLQDTIRCRSFLNLATFQSSPSPALLSNDAIIGGPPFVRFEQLHRTQRDQLPLYRQRYLSARQGQYDLYMLFIEQALDLLNESGRIAFSLSNSFLRSDSGRMVRGYIAANIEGRGRLRHKLEQLVLDQPDSDMSIRPLQPKATASSRWKLASSDDSRWLERVRLSGVPLGQLVTVAFGLSTGIDRLLLLKKTGRVSGGIILAKSQDNEDHTIRLEEAATRSVLRGHQLRGYQPPKLQHVYHFPYDTKGRVFEEDDLRVRFPLMYAYLLSKQAELSKRTLAKGCPWYSTFRRWPQRVSQGPRWLSAKITSGNSFSLIGNSQLLAHNSVVVLTDRRGTLDPYYLLGIVNSKIFTRYISLTMPKINVGRYSLQLSRLRRFPVPDPASENIQKTLQTISSLVQDIVQQSIRRLPSQELVKTVDRQVADLYGVDL